MDRHTTAILKPVLAALLATTFPASSETLRFVVLGDTQSGSGAGVAGIVPQLLTDIAARNPAFVVFPGDLVGTGSVSTFSDWKSLTSAFGNLRYMVPGNHDLPGRPATNGDWQSTFDWLPDSQEVPNITTANPGDTVKGIDRMDYYVDVTPEVRIISVTTDRDTVSGESPNFGSDGILGGPPRALDWFQSVMALPSTLAKEHVFVFTHHPVTTQSGSSSAEEESTAAEWWKSIAGTSDLFAGATADALFTGHVHAYIPNHPDPHSHTAEAISGVGGGTHGSVAHRHVHGFVEVVIDDGGAVSSTLFGDSNGSAGGWSFTEQLDTFPVTASGGLPRGELALYQFEAGAPDEDSSVSPLSKHHHLHFNGAGASIVNDPVRGSVLGLDGASFVDAKNIGDQNFQVLRDLRIKLWAKAEGVLGAEAIDNMMVAFGDADGAIKVSGAVQAQQLGDEIANYPYQFYYVSDGRLRLRWEYRASPVFGAAPDVVSLTSTEAVADPDQWHEIEILRDADSKLVRFLVDGAPLGYELEFSRLPTGGGVGSLYLGALPNIAHLNTGGIATFAGRMDDVFISSEEVTVTTRCLHGLACTTDPVAETVALAWSPPDSALDAIGIRIERDGVVIASLPLTATGHVDSPSLPGSGQVFIDYSVYTYGGTEGDACPVRTCTAFFNRGPSSSRLIHHWNFDETSGLVAADAVGGLDLVLANFAGTTSHWVTGHFDGGLQFDGTDNFGSNALGPGPNEPAGGGSGTDSSLDLTVSVRVWHDSLTGNQRYLGWGGNGGSGYRRCYFGWTDSGDQMTFAFGASTGNAATTENPMAGWVLYTTVWDASASRVTIYENATQIGTAVLSVPAEAAYEVNASLPFNVGKNYFGTSAFFTGTMDDLAIWNAALDQPAIEYVFNNGVPAAFSFVITDISTKLAVDEVTLTWASPSAGPFDIFASADFQTLGTQTATAVTSPHTVTLPPPLDTAPAVFFRIGK